MNTTRTNLHFKVVAGSDNIDQESAIKRYASGKDLGVDGVVYHIKLSLYNADTTEGTLSGESAMLQSVNGLIYVYNVSDLKSFKWVMQMSQTKHSPRTRLFERIPKVLCGSVSGDGSRAVEYGRALEFARSANMAYCEAAMRDNDLEIEKAIIVMIREKVLPPTTEVIGRHHTISATGEARNRPTFSKRVSMPIPIEHPHTDFLYSEELSILTAAMIDLNSSVATLSNVLATDGDIDTKSLVVVSKQAPGSQGATSPLKRFIKVAVDADKCVKLAQAKIISLKKASDETLSALVKQLEEKHRRVDELTAESHHLQQLLDEANAKNRILQEQIKSLQQVQDSRREVSINWKIDGAEVKVVGEPIGKGGYATVSVADFRGSKVAAKCLYGVILNSYNRGMFEREMNIAARIRHPNLVQFMGAVIDKEPIILMELMSTTLRDVIPKEQNKLTQEQIPPICRDVARALAYLHAMKPEPIIHRDVSSANILLEPSANSLWRAKVSDYGSANFLSMLNTKAPGNAVYAAPEAQSPQQQSPKMDVFSFGVLVMEMYLREFPDPNNRDQMVHEVGLLHPDIKFLSIIKDCLHIDPKGRLSMYDILQHLNDSQTP